MDLQGAAVKASGMLSSNSDCMCTDTCMSIHMCIDPRKDPCIDPCTGMCIDLCTDMCVSKRVHGLDLNGHVHRYVNVGIFVGMSMCMCMCIAWTCARAPVRHVHRPVSRQCP